ncbi:hypothetical protein AB0J01_38045 [Streptomyces sp. NPDC050204]|uniref:hypothetical protein n=1 Tax=Streptomyces sp. NPDC050204 TaxID=3155514 RepID=UPI00343402F4
MFRARVKDGGREVLAARIDDGPVWYTGKQPLVCTMCDAGVHGKGTYVKRNGASYRAHFALNPKTSHEETCPFNPVEFITSVARGAQDLAHVQDGVLKLTLPGDVEGLAPLPDQADPHPPQNAVSARRIDTVAPPLPPLLNCAARIARFLQLNAFDDKVVSRFKVQPHGRRSPIPWGRFCYGPTAAAYGELVRRLDTPKSAPSHPVAVYGTVQRVRRDRKGRPFVFLADDIALDGQEFEVVLRSMHPTLIKPLTAGTHVLAVGDWRTFADGRVPQLRLFAEEAWQIAYWHTDEDTGAVSQPARPPAVTAHQRATERPARGPSRRTSRPTGAGRRPAAPPARRTAAPPAAPPVPPVRPAPAAEAADVPQHGPQLPAPVVPSTDVPRTPPSTAEAPVPPATRPAVPPRPSHPPLPASPPLVPRGRRKGLPGWLGRRRKGRS